MQIHKSVYEVLLGLLNQITFAACWQRQAKWNGILCVNVYIPVVGTARERVLKGCAIAATHNAQWLHKSNKLINFWNTLRSLRVAGSQSVERRSQCCFQLPWPGDQATHSERAPAAPATPPAHINHWIFGSQLSRDLFGECPRSEQRAESSALWIKRKQNWLIAGQTPFQNVGVCVCALWVARK